MSGMVRPARTPASRIIIARHLTPHGDRLVRGHRQLLRADRCEPLGRAAQRLQQPRLHRRLRRRALVLPPLPAGDGAATVGIHPAAGAALRYRHRQLPVPYLRDPLGLRGGRRADYSVPVRLLGGLLLAYACPALVGGTGRLGGVRRHDAAAGDSLPGRLRQRILQLLLRPALRLACGWLAPSQRRYSMVWNQVSLLGQ